MDGWTPESDPGLMARVVLGDEEAFAALYDRYAAAVFGAAVRLLGDRTVAEEVVQETYLALWNRAERFSPAAGSLIGWLLTIARNRSVDRLRAAGRRPALVSIGGQSSNDLPDDEAFERVLAAGEPVGVAAVPQDPADAMQRNWTRGVVRAVLAALPDMERLALELAYDEGLTQTEIAERLGWPLGTVKTRTRRALLRLRGSLEGALGDDDAVGGAHGSR